MIILARQLAIFLEFILFGAFVWYAVSCIDSGGDPSNGWTMITFFLLLVSWRNIGLLLNGKKEH